MASAYLRRLGTPLSSCRRPTAIVICVLCLVWPPALAVDTDLVAVEQLAASARPAITDLVILPAKAAAASSALVVLSTPRSSLQPTACDDFSSIIAYDLNISTDNDLRSGLLLDDQQSADALAPNGHIPDAPLPIRQIASYLDRIAEAVLLIASLAVFSLLRHTSASNYQLLLQNSLAPVKRHTRFAYGAVSPRFSAVYERIKPTIAHYRIAFSRPYEQRIAALDEDVARLQRCQLLLLAELCGEKRASSTLRNDLAAANVQIASNEARLARAEYGVLDLNKQLFQAVTASDEAIQILRDNAKQLDACLHDALTELTLSRDDNIRYAARLSAADARAHALVAERSELENVVQVLREEVSEIDARCAAQRDHSVTALALVAEEKCQLEQQFAAAEEETERVQQQLAEVTCSLVELRADNDALDSQLASDRNAHAREIADLHRVREASYAQYSACETYLGKWIAHMQYRLQQWHDAYPDADLPTDGSAAWEELCATQPPVVTHPEAVQAAVTPVFSDSSPPSSPPPPHLAEASVTPAFEHLESSIPAAAHQDDAPRDCSGLDDDDPVFDEFTIEELNAAPQYVRRSAFLFKDVPDGFAIVIDAPPVDAADADAVKDDSEDWTPEGLGVYPRYRQWGRRILRGYDDEEAGRIWEIWEGTGPGRGWHRVVSHSQVVIDPVTQMEKSEYTGYTYHNVRQDGQAVWVRDHIPDAEDFARLHPALVDRLAALVL
ncbi:hypothetical protein AURDEDRAFT_185874 [Auricularia subglabra TFB-10046 SS5]|nr:hypothetical protein AURDEDRAFT_185874 [Auricularia subglabra TFB-10046 SS5]